MKVTEKHLRAYLKSRNFAETTATMYDRVVKQYIADVKPGTQGWESRAVEWPSTLECAPSSQAIYLAVVKAFTNWCVEERVLRKSPLRRVVI
ncbi:MAG: hypothetical protein GF400_09715, partial [Candidatus Eisenbacteria bacterium]|nr:hypothetical protein [Candidatus Eisenbacteria bacterium]